MRWSPSRSAGNRVPRTLADLDVRAVLRRLLALALLIVLVGSAISSLPGLGTLRSRFAQANGLLLAAIALLKLGSCLSNVVAFREVFCSKLGWRFSYRLGMAEQGLNVLLPAGGAGGLALGAWVLRQQGLSGEQIARRSVAFFVLTSVPNFICAAILGPLLLTGALSGRAPVIPTAVFSALAWLTAALTAALPRLLGRIDRRKRAGAIGKLRTAAALLGAGISDAGLLLRERRWRAIAGACGYLGFDITAMIVAFAAFGGAPPIGPLMFGYVIGQLGGLLPLPGGVGGTDGGLIGATVLYGSSLSQAAAAVLAYRTFQLGVPAILGTIAFVRLRTQSAQPA